LDRLNKLKSIGLVSADDVRRKVNADNWEYMFEELVSFQRDHDHYNVEFSKNPALAIWTIGQREWRCRRNVYIVGGEQFLADKIKRLDDIGFDWQPENYFFGETVTHEIQKRWNCKFLELMQFKEDQGHFDVPFFFFENPSLGFFVKYQRSWPTGAWGDYPKEWKQELDQVGFTWEYNQDMN